MFDFTIIGGGIVGISAAYHLLSSVPGAKVLVLEKETALGLHQTGRNSGVIHSGIYYRPGSLKARFAVEGSRAMYAFCRRHDIPHERCGKVIVAVREEEFPQLEALYRRGIANGLRLEKWTPEELREREPHVRGLEALIRSGYRDCGLQAGIAGAGGDGGGEGGRDPDLRQSGGDRGAPGIYRGAYKRRNGADAVSDQLRGFVQRPDRPEGPGFA